MKTRDFCSLVAKTLKDNPEGHREYSQDEVFRLFLTFVEVGKKVLASGDEFRLPGLGKLYCTDIPDRVELPNGTKVRDLDAWQAAQGPKKKIRCKFSPFKSCLDAAVEEDLE